MTSASKVFRGSAVRMATTTSLASSAFAQLMLVVSGVLTARMLGPDGRGFLALFIVVPSTIAQLGGLGLSLACTYYIARFPSKTRLIVRAVRRPALVQVGVLTLVHVAVTIWLVVG